MPVVDRVPLIVDGWAKVTDLTPAEAGPATEKLLNVFVPDIEADDVVVLVSDRL